MNMNEYQLRNIHNLDSSVYFDIRPFVDGFVKMV
jgi:hypothetical protein